MKAIKVVFAVLLVAAHAAATFGEILYMVTDLGTLGGSTSYACRINNLGQVVGESLFPNEVWQKAFRTGPMGLVSDPGTYLGTLGGSDSSAYGINQLGQAVGCSRIAGNQFVRAFRTLPNGLIVAGSDLGTLGGPHSIAYDINDSGQAVGTSTISYDGSSPVRAFRTSPGGYLNEPGCDLGTLGGNDSEARAINNLGQVVGAAQRSNGRWHAYRTQPNGSIGSSDQLGTFGGTTSWAYDINDLGQVVGCAQTASGNTRAFRTSPGGFLAEPGADLGSLGGTYSEARGINQAGEIVGWSLDSMGEPRAFYASATGGIVDLNLLIAPTSTWFLRRAYDINDSGFIVGEGWYDSDGPGGQEAVIHAFRLDPIPEPGTLLLLGVGALLMRRR